MLKTKAGSSRASRFITGFVSVRDFDRAGFGCAVNSASLAMFFMGRIGVMINGGFIFQYFLQDGFTGDISSSVATRPIIGCH